ncbi:peptidase inhibitor family I36 protein [Saccharopolyspora taberi]|uniref:Peptidase inhibitor family I36 n=1 Tax=Saccharopolyspora taberi TaxID=60895 RepID=A0ABN3VC21_9PSEU
MFSHAVSPASVTDLNARRRIPAPRRRPSTLRRIPPSGPRLRRSTLLRLSAALVLTLLSLLSLLAGATAAQGAPALCPADTFCAYESHQFQGRSHHAELAATPLERCVPLPPELNATSFVNNTGRPVTVYQDPTCSTEADFRTFPTGTFVPQAPYVGRAIQIWSH